MDIDTKERIEYLKPIKEYPDISGFYTGKTVLVTGGLGFLGQNFIEKLIWTCPDVSRIYLLIRDKKNKPAQERLDRLLEQDLFDRVRSRDGSFKDKIQVVKGDLLEQDIGLSPEDRSKLVKEVDIILHSAATVRFDEPITAAIDSNVKATKNMLQFAIEVQSLSVFAYVSTAFTNCHIFDIREKLYEPIGDWNQVLELRQGVDPVVFNILSRKVNCQMPNTYVYTKHLAEQMVYEYGDRIPLVILRPAIVCCSYEEPVPGWCANVLGPSGLLLGMTTGIIRCILGEPNRRQTDFVPCDKVINAIMYATYLRPYQRPDIKPIYNLASTEHDVDLKRFIKQAMQAVKEHPTKYRIWKPRVTITPHFKVFYLYFMMFQLFPALLIDLLLKLFGIKPMLFNTQKVIYRSIVTTQHFSRNTFYFDNSNLHVINKFMAEKDRKKMKFIYTQQEIDILMYSGEAMGGATRYLRKKMLKHTPQDDWSATTVQMIQDVADMVVKSSVILYIIWFVYKNNLIGNLISSTLKFILNF